VFIDNTNSNIVAISNGFKCIQAVCDRDNNFKAFLHAKEVFLLIDLSVFCQSFF